MRDDLDLVAAARDAAARAAQFLRTAPRPDAAAWIAKSERDYVTDVDRTAERLAAATLLERVPGSHVQGEELSPGAAAAGGVRWIVDPLDGTTNFLHGYPQYAVSIGCVVDGVLRAGVVYDVGRDLAYHASAGGGAWCGERRLRVSDVSDPRRALVGTGFPIKDLDSIPRYVRQLAAVIAASAGARRAGSAALDLVDVAAGRFDAFWELALAPWDVAGGVMLVREAGGVVTTLDGGADVLRGGSIVAGNPSLHPWLLRLLAEP